MSKMQKHYDGIDGLRTIAAIGIVLMHIAANTNYQIDGYIYNNIIPSFTNFVFLFMTVSAFGMCCGYYEKILNNNISLTDFYAKRFVKILPFFTVLVLLDIIVSPSMSSLYEAFVNITLMFGFLPNEISVIGVGWFLGLIFVFYLIFPFFCVLIHNKKIAWFSFAVSIMCNYICGNYFVLGRKNILYSACFFLAGGILFLYKDKIADFNSRIILLMVAATIVLYYVIGGNTYTFLAVSITMLMYAIAKQGGLLDNKFTKFFSGISMEIYLAHMMTFRIIEKAGILYVFGNGWIQYLITTVLVIIGTIIFALVTKNIIDIALKRLSQVNL